MSTVISRIYNCDVPGCDAFTRIFPVRRGEWCGRVLRARGWAIRRGHHLCPVHSDLTVPPNSTGGQS